MNQMYFINSFKYIYWAPTTYQALGSRCYKMPEKNGSLDKREQFYNFILLC